jgi:predicted transcriptional regulator
LNVKVKDNDTKNTLLAYINSIPGIRYRELLRLTGLANGVLTYYLKILERSKQVRVKRQSSSMTRYFPRVFTSRECLIIANVRRDTARQIILCILEHNNRPCTFNDIVQYTKRSPSTISWHLKRLKDAGMVSVRNYHRYQRYKLRGVVIKLLNKYQDRILENQPDNLRSFD